MKLHVSQCVYAVGQRGKMHFLFGVGDIDTSDGTLLLVSGAVGIHASV